MPRPRAIHPWVKLDLRFPAPLRAKLDIYLFSPVEGRVPLGRYNEFMNELLESFFREREICPECGRQRSKETP